MARSRNIKPGFFKNEYLAELEPLTRILFEGLWCLADREGRLEDRPKKIKAEILPYDKCNIDKMLDDLANAKEPFIIRYEVNGEKYIQVTNFSKHQNPNKKEVSSEIPAPIKYMKARNEHSTSTVLAPNKHITDTADSLNPHSDSFNLIPDSLNPHFEENTEREKENEIAAALQRINSEAFNFRLNGLSSEFLQCAEIWLKDGVDPDLIIKALAIGSDKASSLTGICPYARKVIQGWIQEGIKTLAQWEEKNKPEPAARGKPTSKFKPQNSANFEQRQYDEDFYNNMYDNVKNNSS